jgi:hypothetical protein
MIEESSYYINPCPQITNNGVAPPTIQRIVQIPYPASVLFPVEVVPA